MALDRINATALLDGGVTTADIADGAVTSAKLDTNIAVTGTLTAAGDMQTSGEFKANGGVVINEDSLDVDFRVESNGNANTLFVDGGSDRVGIGTASPSELLDVYSGSTNARIQVQTNDSSSVPQIEFRNTAAGCQIGMPANANAMTFTTADNERMRIDSSGNVGISTSNPLSQLTVGGNANTTAKPTVAITDTTNGATISMRGQSHKIAFDVTSGGVPKILMDNSGLEFKTGTLDAEGDVDVKINNNGHLLLNTTSHNFGSTQPIQEIYTPGTANGGLSIRSNDSSTSTYHGLGIWVRGSAGMTTGTGYAVVFFHGQSGSSRGSITVTGSSTAYNTTSDYRLKENVEYDFDATSRLKQLKPARFNFIEDADTTVDGFLAHEVQDVVPEAITGTKDAMRDEEYEVTPAVEATYDDDGNILTEAVPAVMGTRSVPDYQGIDQGKLVPLLVKSLQEALTKIDELETRIASLEAN